MGGKNVESTPTAPGTTALATNTGTSNKRPFDKVRCKGKHNPAATSHDEAGCWTVNPQLRTEYLAKKAKTSAYHTTGINAAPSTSSTANNSSEFVRPAFATNKSLNRHGYGKLPNFNSSESMPFEEVEDIPGELERSAEKFSEEEDEEMELIADRLKEVRELSAEMEETTTQQRTDAIPRTRIEDIDRVALQTRITDGTIDKRTNRTLTVSEIKGSDSAIIVCALEYPEVNPGAPTPKIKIDPHPHLVEVSQSPHTHITIEGAAKASALRY
ncbi:hypothetical protein H4Q26_006205 [Puccinia striiformis f. sp. tritici PST-130]|nr:hypothetical protein H4Q26_006205 [Puccinia striiformis f. sp. tritici PST-130]